MNFLKYLAIWVCSLGLCFSIYAADFVNAWIEVDLGSFTNEQITTFFSVTENSAQYNALTRPKQLILQCYWDARPNRLYKSLTTPKKWLAYCHVPKLTADEIATLPSIITDNVRFVARNVKDIPEALQIEYFGEVIDLTDTNKNYPQFTILWGVEP